MMNRKDRPSAKHSEEAKDTSRQAENELLEWYALHSVALRCIHEELADFSGQLKGALLANVGRIHKEAHNLTVKYAFDDSEPPRSVLSALNELRVILAEKTPSQSTLAVLGRRVHEALAYGTQHLMTRSGQGDSELVSHFHYLLKMVVTTLNVLRSEIESLLLAKSPALS